MMFLLDVADIYVILVTIVSVLRVLQNRFPLMLTYKNCIEAKYHYVPHSPTW
jgi:hypothetical protein